MSPHFRGVAHYTLNHTAHAFPPFYPPRVWADFKLRGHSSHTPLPSCIIRSTFLGAIKEAFDADPDLPNLLLAPYFVECIKKCEASWRQVVSQAALLNNTWHGALEPLAAAHALRLCRERECLRRADLVPWPFCN